MASPVGWLFVALLLVSIVWGRLRWRAARTSTAWYAASLAPVALDRPLGGRRSSRGSFRRINDDALSLTIANSASSQLTLTVMTIIAAIGVPLVLFYFYLIYRIFAGKTQLGGEGY